MHRQQSLLAQEEGEQSLHLMQWKLLMLSRALGKASDPKHWHASLAAPCMQLRVGIRGPPKTSIWISRHRSQQDTSKLSFFKCFFKVSTIVSLESPFVHAGLYHPQLGFQHKTITYL